MRRKELILLRQRQTDRQREGISSQRKYKVLNRMVISKRKRDKQYCTNKQWKSSKAGTITVITKSK